MAPLAYAQMQVVAQAAEATGGFDDASSRCTHEDEYLDVAAAGKKVIVNSALHEGTGWSLRRLFEGG
jgi:hypothetical protein